MLKTANILTMLPDVLRNVWELQAVALAEDKELNKLWQETEKVFCDQFVETATENGVSRWEQMLNIAAKPSDTLAERKFKILSLLSAQLPFTISSLQEQLKNLCGENGYRLSVNHGTYTLTVRVALSVRKNFEAVEGLLCQLVPANMVIDLSLMYNQHQTLQPFIHGQLHTHTHQSLREMELNQ